MVSEMESDGPKHENGTGDGDSDERRRVIQKRSRSRSRSPSRKRDRRSGGGGAASNDNMVYISNIPYDVRWMEIKDLVREKAGETVFVEILEDKNGRSKGAAVVEFRDHSSVAKCVDALHKYEMKGRLIVAKEIRDPIAFFRKVKEDTGVDFMSRSGGSSSAGGGRSDRWDRGGSDRRSGGRGGSDGRMPVAPTYETYGLSPSFLRQLGIEGPLCNRVFVANLPYNVQSGRVWEIFSLAGKVTCVDVQMDKDGKSKGLAVVDFSHPIEAVQAISMLNAQRLQDRTLAVKMDKFEKPIERRPGELPGGLRGVGMGLGANGSPLNDIASVITSVQAPQVVAPQVAPQPLMTAGPFNSSAFQQQQQPSYGGGSYGGGQVAAAVATPQPAQVGGFGGGGGYSTQVSASPQSQTSGFGGGYQPTVLDSATGYGRQIVDSFDRSASLGSSAIQPVTPTRCIAIKNLPLDYTWQIVRDKVRNFGDVEFVEMMSAGTSKVRFKQISDGERARGALQGTTVEGRMINVDFLFD